jgi:hypothetical protein
MRSETASAKLVAVNNGPGDANGFGGGLGGEIGGVS